MATERRRVNLITKKIEVRAESAENGDKVITGVIPYNKRSVDLSSYWDDKWHEVLAPGCFAKTLGDKAEVKALRNHNDTEILGNTKSGTLELTDTPTGLVCRCVLPRTSYAEDLFETITRGDCTTMSFGMIVFSETWEDEGDSALRTINSAKLDEVSFGVTYPAYPDTNAFESRTLKALEVKPENMTETMKNKILSLADEIRSAEGTTEGEQQVEKTTDGQASATPPAENTTEPKNDVSVDEEAQKKAEEESRRNAEADAFIFEQSY